MIGWGEKKKIWASVIAFVVGCGSTNDTPVGPMIDAESAADAAAETGGPEAGKADVFVPRSAICSVDNWCWEEPRPQGNDIDAIWASDASHLYAVGQLGTFLRFDGATWTKVATDDAGALYAVWGSAPNDVWIVGEGGMIGHFDGAVVTRLPFPSGGAAVGDASPRPKLLGVSGTGKTDVWAVGEGGTLLHFDGSAWSNPASGTVATLRAIWANRSDDVWAVGDGGIVLHFDGVDWKPESRVVLTTDILAVHGTGKSDVWVVGVRGAVAHFDGTSWTPATVDATIAFRAVVADEVDSVWAVGDNGVVWRFGPVPATGDAGATDGAGAKAWAKVASGAQASLLGGFRAGADDLWFVGAWGEILHWKSQSWTAIASSTPANRLAIGGVSSNDAWIVGDETLHCVAGGWTPVDRGTDRALYGLSVTTPQSGWAIGTAGSIVRLDSDLKWQNVESPTTKWLHGIWTSGTSAGWIVGGAGTALALLNGTLWQAVSTGGVTVDLLDVWGSALDDVWAVGDGGTILHWRGTSWTLVPNGADGGTTNELRGVWGSGPKDVWAVGTGGTILHFNGAAWSSVASGATYSLNDVWGTGPRDAWAVGTGGTLLHWDGAAWSSVASGTDTSLNAVWGADKKVWIVGENGAILSRQGG